MYNKLINDFIKNVKNNTVDTINIEDSIIEIGSNSNKDFFPVDIFYTAINECILDEFVLNIKMDDLSKYGIVADMAKKINFDTIKFVFKKLDKDVIYVADINSLDITGAVNSLTLKFSQIDDTIQMYPLDLNFDDMNDWIDNRASKSQLDIATSGKTKELRENNISIGEYTSVMMTSYILSALVSINTLSKIKILKEPQRKYVTVNQKKKSKNNKSKKTKIVNTYYVSNADFKDNETKRLYQRSMKSWTVKGHFRTYKNGKTIWISPYTKGTGKKTPKNYEL